MIISSVFFFPAQIVQDYFVRVLLSFSARGFRWVRATVRLGGFLRFSEELKTLTGPDDVAVIVGSS